MTFSREEALARNREAQRRRRERPGVAEMDRAARRAYRNRPEVLAKVLEAARAERRNPATWATAVLRNIRYRAKSRGIEFSLVPEDLALPTHCPVLGIPLVVGATEHGPLCPSSPSIDRLDNTKGYTRDNVRVISNRANLLKKDATTAEIRALLAYMEEGGAP